MHVSKLARPLKLAGLAGHYCTLASYSVVAIQGAVLSRGLLCGECYTIIWETYIYCYPYVPYVDATNICLYMHTVGTCHLPTVAVDLKSMRLETLQPLYVFMFKVMRLKYIINWSIIPHS